MVVIRLSPGAGLRQGQVGNEEASIREIRHHTEAPINSAIDSAPIDSVCSNEGGGSQELARKPVCSLICTAFG